MLPVQNLKNNEAYWGPFSRQDTFSPDQLVVGNHKIVTEAVIFAKNPDHPYYRGLVVGCVTATGQYVVCQSGATDGSQTPAGIVTDWVDATEGAAQGAVYLEGEFNLRRVIADQSWSDAALKSAFLSGPGNIYLKNSISNEIV